MVYRASPRPVRKVNLERPGPLGHRDPMGGQAMQDQRERLEQLGQQGRQVQAASLVLVAQTALLVIEAHLVWLDLLVRPAPLGGAALKERLDRQARQARTERLVRRGVPVHLARQGLRAL